ncbi:hypothetical protein Tco_0164779 [Tanacetum coccineum]
MVLLNSPTGSSDNVLDNQIFDTSSNESHPSNVDLYLNDEEDDDDKNNHFLKTQDVKATGSITNDIDSGYSICFENIFDLINSIKDIKRNIEHVMSIIDGIKLLLAVATNMSCVVENDIGKEGSKDNFKEKDA